MRSVLCVCCAMRVSLSACVSAPLPLLALPLRTVRRPFSVMQRGHDRERASLFAQLGFAQDSEAHCVSRTREELRQGFMREAMKLHDPQNNPKDAAKLAELQRAFALLSENVFRANYAAHHCASPDAALHVRVDGGQTAANHNPEHRALDYVNHAVSEAHTSRSFGAFAAPAESPKPFNAHDARGPQPGASVPFLLRVSFDESMLGCTKTVVYERRVVCQRCNGDGRAQQQQQKQKQKQKQSTRRCPQCRGRGAAQLPSSTYHVERVCAYCAGSGEAPPAACALCRGTGVGELRTERLAVNVRPGTANMSTRRLRGKGHEGVRGGAAGDLVLTVLVQEHRLFHRDGLDLHIVVPVPLSTALLGGVAAVETLRGPRQLRVPPCARNGQCVVMDGYGVCLGDKDHNDDDNEEDGDDLNNDEGRRRREKGRSMAGEVKRGSGHLYAHLLVIVPAAEELTGRQRHALEVFTAASSEHEEMQDTSESLKRRFRHWLPGA